MPVISLRLITFFDGSLASDELTGGSWYQSTRRAKPAVHLGSFSIVRAGTVLPFFSPLSHRDPKWDTDILAGSVLGPALDAPECSAQAH